MFSFWYVRTNSRHWPEYFRRKKSHEVEGLLSTAQVPPGSLDFPNLVQKETYLLGKWRVLSALLNYDLICLLLFYAEKIHTPLKYFFHSPYCLHATVTHTLFKNKLIWYPQLATSLRQPSFLYQRMLWYLSLLPQKLRSLSWSPTYCSSSNCQL